jgi:hypothetical protein
MDPGGSAGRPAPRPRNRAFPAVRRPRPEDARVSPVRPFFGRGPIRTVRRREPVAAMNPAAHFPAGNRPAAAGADSDAWVPATATRPLAGSQIAVPGGFGSRARRRWTRALHARGIERERIGSRVEWLRRGNGPPMVSRYFGSSCGAVRCVTVTPLVAISKTGRKVGVAFQQRRRHGRTRRPVDARASPPAV